MSLDYILVQDVEEPEPYKEDIIEFEIDQTPNITARIDTIDSLGEMQIIFNTSIDIPTMIPLD